MEELSDRCSVEEEEDGMVERCDGEVYNHDDTDHEVVPLGNDRDMAPPGNDTDNEVVPPGDETDEVAPAGDYTSDRNNEVLPPGEEENQGLHTSPTSSSGHASSPSIQGMASEPSEEAALQNLAPSLQQLLVTESNHASIYMRAIVLQAGINVSDNVTVSTSEGQQETPESQDSPEDDAGQPEGQEPVNLQSPCRSEISLHEEQNVYNPYHNMRLIMDSEFGQSSLVGQVPPPTGGYLSERNFNMGEIVSIWEMSDDLYSRDQLLNRFIEYSLYRPNIIQRGGYLALLHMLKDIAGESSGDAHALRDAVYGVLLNNQDFLEPSNGHFRLGHEYLSVDCCKQRTLRCCLPNSDFNFIRKTYCVNEWCGEQMIVPFLCDSRSIVQPLGLTWLGKEIQVFLPVIQGESLSDVLTHCGRCLTQQEVTLLTYWLLNIVSNLQRCNCLHRNITPDNVIISHVNKCLYLVGNGALCRLQNALSMIPSNLSLYTAPELVRGEEHPRADLYSAGCTMISALNKKIPFFDINGIQKTMRSYLFSIGKGSYSPTVALNATPGLDNFLRDVLTDMVAPSVPGMSAKEILRSHFWNQGREPLWSNSFFQPCPPAVPDVSRPEVQHQEHLNIPSEDILLSASDQVEVTNVEETTMERKYDDDDSHLDSGRYTNTTNEFCTVMVLEDGMEVCRLPLPWGERASRVYREVNAKMKISQGYVLQHNGLNVKFDEQLNELTETHSTMPLCLHLHRQNVKQDHRPSELWPRSNQRSRSRTVIEGAAYNGDDHVVYDDQARNQSSLTGESEALFDTSDFDDTTEGAGIQGQVPPTLPLTMPSADPGTGESDSEGLTQTRRMCALSEALADHLTGQADSERLTRSRGTCALSEALADPLTGQADSERLTRSRGTCALREALADPLTGQADSERLTRSRGTCALSEALADPLTGQADSERLTRSRGTCAFEDATKEDATKEDIEGETDAISDVEFTLYEDYEHPEEDELQEEVCPGDISDTADEEGSQNTDEENADDTELENELLEEAPSDFRSTNMDMSQEEAVDAFTDGIGDEGGSNDADNDASVCGDSPTYSEVNFTEDEGDIGNAEGESVAGSSSRSKPSVSVVPEGSDSKSHDEEVGNVDSEVNRSESDEDDEGGDSGLTGDATESSSFSDVGVTVTNEASTPMSEECGPLEDDD